MAHLEVVLNRDDVHEQIPYAVICEIRYGSRWDTMRRKRRWMAEFTKEERDATYKLFPKAHNWYVGRGVPDLVRMSLSTYRLWQKLGDFCGTL